MQRAFAAVCLLSAATAHKYQTYQRDHHLRKLSDSTKPENNLWEEYFNENSVLQSHQLLGCMTCSAAMQGVQALLEVDFIHNGILSLASWACILTGAMGDRFKTCPQIVSQFGEPMFDVVEQYLVTKDRICNESLGLCKSPIITEIDLNEVVSNILATKPLAIRNDDYIQNLYDQMAQSTEERSTLRALHLSDVHLDFEYTPGTVSNCREYLCCRVDVGYATRPGQVAAGEWGSSNCDIPVKTFQSMLDYVVETDLPDMVFWTGDNSAHNVWDNTADESVAYTVKVTEMIKDAFDGKNVTVMPIQGNHDTWVEEIESFAAPGINYEINNFKQYWQEWLSEEAYEKFGEYGYYSQPIELLNGKSMPAGSRVIAYNTQACNSLNWYVWGEREDPGHMFAWLEQQLLEVEAEGGIAMLIAHYTPNQCQHQFGTRYRALMERFQHVVRFTMHGHTHTAYYEIVQSMSNPGTPIMLANVGGSVTTYTLQNPSYIMIDFDQETMLPINMYTYYIDLDKANTDGYPTWELLHDYLETYGIPDLSPRSMKELSERFLTDEEAAKDFAWNMHVQRGDRPTSVDQLDLYCTTASSEMHERHECLESGGMSQSRLGLGYSMWTAQGFADWLVGDWISVSMNP